jgi:hypothetical protein
MATFEKFIDEENLPIQKEKKIGSYLIGKTQMTQKRLWEREHSAKLNWPLTSPQEKKLQSKF